MVSDEELYNYILEQTNSTTQWIIRTLEKSKVSDFTPHTFDAVITAINDCRKDLETKKLKI